MFLHSTQRNKGRKIVGRTVEWTRLLTPFTQMMTLEVARESWYAQEDPWAEIQRNELSVDFLNLTISDHGLILPSVPVAPVNTYIAAQVRESTPARRRPTAAPQGRQPTPANAIAAPLIPIAAPHIHGPTAVPHVREPTPADAIAAAP
jgi:hypothetical protein